LRPLTRLEADRIPIAENGELADLHLTAGDADRAFEDMDEAA
jgi:hypothetical protein